jgi:hypothetical protein
MLGGGTVYVKRREVVYCRYFLNLNIQKGLSITTSPFFCAKFI